MNFDNNLSNNDKYSVDNKAHIKAFSTQSSFQKQHLVPDKELLKEASLELLQSLQECFDRYEGQGLGNGTSHRFDIGLGNRMVSNPVEIPAYYDRLMRQGSNLLLSELQAESDSDTVERVNMIFGNALRASGIEITDFFNESTILAVKAQALNNGRISTWCDFVPVPMNCNADGQLVPTHIPDSENTWRNLGRLVEEDAFVIAYLMIEGQGSFAGYFGFAERYMQHGAFGTTEAQQEIFRQHVARSIFRNDNDFTIVDYKIRERAGETHHLPGDKFTMSEVWGNGLPPFDPRDLPVAQKLGMLKETRLVNTATPREYGIVFRELKPQQRTELQELLNDVDKWVEHPAAMALITKGAMASAYQKHGAATMMIPSYRSCAELKESLHFPAQHIISKPTSGDSGYGITMGTPEEVERVTADAYNQLVQPLVDILRVAPNRLRHGPLANGGTLELRSINIDGYGMTRIGAHTPYQPNQGMTMVHQEYIMPAMKELVHEMQSLLRIDQPEAWKRMLLMANAGFGMFKVRE
jgi:hypothetical protein